MSKKGSTPGTPEGATEGERTFTLKEAAAEVGLTDFRVRTAIRKGQLASVKVPIGDSKTLRHMITEAALKAWREASGAHTRRADGRNKYTLYATAEEYEAVMKLIAEHQLQTPIARANAKKTEPAAE